MKLENGTPWKSASMAAALPIVLILIGYGGNDLRKSRAVMVQTNWRKVSVACCLPCWTR